MNDLEGRNEIRRISTRSQAPTAGNGRNTGRDRRGRWVAGDQWDRFWAQVTVGPGCWHWTGRLDLDGYGLFRAKVDGTWRPVRAHRWAYQLARGPIPAGQTIDHLCHTHDTTCPGGPSCPHRRCVRIDHLAPVSNAENLRRRHARTQQRRGTPTAPTAHRWRLDASRRTGAWANFGDGETYVTYLEDVATTHVTATAHELGTHVAQYMAETGAETIRATRLDDGEDGPYWLFLDNGLRIGGGPLDTEDDQ